MCNSIHSLNFIFLISIILQFHFGLGDLTLNYYSKSCPKAESIIKEEVLKLYDEHGNTAVSWVRNLFHDCMVKWYTLPVYNRFYKSNYDRCFSQHVEEDQKRLCRHVLQHVVRSNSHNLTCRTGCKKSCDASLLLDTNVAMGIHTEKSDTRNFGMRNFKYVNTIKQALEMECPSTVSCADIIALSARDGAQRLGGPYIEMKTGRRDSRESYAADVQKFIPNHNASIFELLSHFQTLGIDIEGTVAILGAHSVGRVHCVNLVNRLYPTVDPTLDPTYATYLKTRCPTPNPDPEAVVYARNDRETPMILDNMYYKNLLNNKGLLLIDQQLVSNPSTLSYVKKMAADNEYFHQQFSRAMILLSENNPLTGNQGEIRKDCRFVNTD